MPRKPRDYRAEYLRRVERAKARGFKGYGHARYLRKYNPTAYDSIINEHDRKLTQLLNELELTEDDLAPPPMEGHKARRMLYLDDLGVSRSDRQRLERLADHPDFWKVYREIYEKLRQG